jgi:hypothetical protein
MYRTSQKDHTDTEALDLTAQGVRMGRVYTLANTRVSLLHWKELAYGSGPFTCSECIVCSPSEHRYLPVPQVCDGAALGPLPGRPSHGNAGW